MKIYEIGTGYTSIPANKGAATEIVVENLSHVLIELGHDVTVVDIEDSNRLPTDLPIIEVKMPNGFGATDEALGIRHKLKRVVYSIKLAGVLKRILRNTPDGEKVVLHFHNQYNAFFFLKLVSARLRKRALVAYTNHSGAWNGLWAEIEPVLKKRYFQEWYVQKHVDLVFVLNESTRDNIINYLDVDSSNVVVLGNGVDISLYQPLPKMEAERVSASIFGNGTRYFFQCGSIYPNKGQLKSLEALSPFMERDKTLCFAYAGGIIDSAYLDDIAAFSISRGIQDQVRYLGEFKPGEDLARIYAGAVGFLFPSEFEAFGMALLEAMSSGIPVIRNDSSRALKFASENEGFFSFNDEVEFAKCIEIVCSLTENERDELCKASRSFVEQTYSWRVIASNYSTVIQKML